MSESKYLFTDDLCARYRVKRWTVWHWVKLGKLPKPDKSLGRPRWCRITLDRLDARRMEAVQ